MPDYTAMTVPELEAEYRRLADVVDRASAAHKTIRAVLDRRIADAKAAVLLNRLDGPTQDALKRALA